MFKDPIVEEVRRAREAILARCHYHLGELVAYLKAKEREDPVEKVSLPPKRVPGTAKLGRPRRKPDSRKGTTTTRGRVTASTRPRP